ncbi:hypothetical protein [Tautonia plasticadhaerens]|uniref:Uncharacterized protein n=1 Tax=Tautonia plasticadhaerens TaxID=2527974 RepID=A0A518HA99_9BACT|nr:hypothetical protein [Tautonia plasticadhaerens]QDV37773.1 hypothetical protein ElP_57190 [Tautonia plasticadhaerens]
MTTILVPILTALLAVGGPLAAAPAPLRDDSDDPDDGGWIDLFNGRDLAG